MSGRGALSGAHSRWLLAARAWRAWRTSVTLVLSVTMRHVMAGSERKTPLMKLQRQQAARQGLAGGEGRRVGAAGVKRSSCWARAQADADRMRVVHKAEAPSLIE